MNRNQDDEYNRAVEATARGETVPNLPEIIQASRFCRDAFDAHVKQQRAGSRQRARGHRLESLPGNGRSTGNRLQRKRTKARNDSYPGLSRHVAAAGCCVCPLCGKAARRKKR